MKRKNKYDGTILRKITQNFDITFQSAISTGGIVVSWLGDTPASGGITTGNVSYDPEFIQFCELHQEAKMVGLKIKFIPLS